MPPGGTRPEQCLVEAPAWGRSPERHQRPRADQPRARRSALRLSRWRPRSGPLSRTQHSTDRPGTQLGVKNIGAQAGEHASQERVVDAAHQLRCLRSQRMKRAVVQLHLARSRPGGFEPVLGEDRPGNGESALGTQPAWPDAGRAPRRTGGRRGPGLRGRPLPAAPAGERHDALHVSGGPARQIPGAVTMTVPAVRAGCILPLSYDDMTPGPRKCRGRAGYRRWPHPGSYVLPDRS